MVETGLLINVIECYENSCNKNGVCVFVNQDIIDVERPLIWINGNILYFSFQDDEVEDFQIDISEIINISFDDFMGTVISIIELKNGNAILVHNM